jgi:hypothetical protein
MESESENLRHRSREEEESLGEQASGAEAKTLEFETPEELIRHDAKETQVPAEVETRLKQSLADEPKAKPGFLRRLFGGGN